MSDLQKAYVEHQQRAAESNSGMLMGPIQLASDPIAERLDELADLAEVWKRRRQARQSTDSVRAALLNACGGVQSFSDMTDKSRVDRFGR
jgi:hypothetical protein